MNLSVTQSNLSTEQGVPNGYTPTFLPTDEFPTAETLDSWRDEGKPIKLIESLM